MSEEILKGEELLKNDTPRSDGLSTSDLAGVGERRSERKAELETGEQEPLRTSPPALRENVDAAVQGAGTATAPAKVQEERTPLFSADEANNLRARWDSVQVGFVDEPRKAVADADQLVAAAMKRLAEIFADEHQKLEHQWDKGDNVSTEDLRLALRRYRSFFSRLLNV